MSPDALEKLDARFVSDWPLTRVADPRTGREVTCLTPFDATSNVPYFYLPGFSADERLVALMSDVSGSTQAYLVDRTTGRAFQISDHEGVGSMNVEFDWAGTKVTFPTGGDGVRGSSVWVFDLAEGLRLAFDGSLRAGGGAPWIRCSPMARDGNLFMVHREREDGRIAVGRARLDAGVDQQVEEIGFLREGETWCHVLIHPSDPDYVSFTTFPDRQGDESLPPDDRARTRLLDCRTGESSPLVVAPPSERATHEYWSPDGSRIYFHLKTLPQWGLPTSIASVDLGGGDFRLHFTSGDALLGHSMIARAGRFAVSDSQIPGSNELFLADLDRGVAEVLCWPDASGAPHPKHVHPQLSPSGQLALFASDREGGCRVCLVETGL